MYGALRACRFTFVLITTLFVSSSLAQYQKAPQPIHEDESTQQY